jgi:hypothetical protein
MQEHPCVRQLLVRPLWQLRFAACAGLEHRATDTKPAAGITDIVGRNAANAMSQNLEIQTHDPRRQGPRKHCVPDSNEPTHQP